MVKTYSVKFRSTKSYSKYRIAHNIGNFRENRIINKITIDQSHQFRANSLSSGP